MKNILSSLILSHKNRDFTYQSRAVVPAKNYVISAKSHCSLKTAHAQPRLVKCVLNPCQNFFERKPQLPLSDTGGKIGGKTSGHLAWIGLKKAFVKHAGIYVKI